MKYLPPDEPVDLYNDGFGDDDFLQRGKVGRALSDLAERIDDPLVIALDGRWGTGKTHFLKRWVGAHQRQNEGVAKTVYFDAFQHDFQTDPLPALLSVILTRLQGEGLEADTLSKVKNAAYRLAPSAMRVGVALATGGASIVAGPMLDGLVASASEEAKGAVTQYWAREESRRSALEELRGALSDLASDVKSDDAEGASLVVVVDELDRCRPEYALEVLEVIKHVFSVPRVHFILGTNLSALQNSVSVRHGSVIDAEAYLRKFVDLTLTLPDELASAGNDRQRVTKVYLETLMETMGTPEQFREDISTELACVERGNQVSIRDVGKVLSRFALLPSEVAEKQWISGWIMLATSLTFARVLDPMIHKAMLAGSISEDRLLKYYGTSLEDLVEYRGERQNPSYNHRIFWRVWTWRFIRANGEVNPSEEGLTRRDLARQFSDLPTVHEPATLPLRVHRKWLDLFEVSTG